MVSYIEYMKKNPKGYWFKRKLYGWGWVPVRWQGWLFLLVWVGLFVNSLVMVEKSSLPVSETIISMAISVVLLLIILFLVCYGTGENPRWSWGK